MPFAGFHYAYFLVLLVPIVVVVLAALLVWRIQQAVRSGARAYHGEPTGQLAAPSGVADELSKLAVLLQQGLLTRAEFDDQKTRLLGSQPPATYERDQ